MAVAPIPPRAAVASAPAQSPPTPRLRFSDALREARGPAAPAAGPAPLSSLEAIERAQRRLDEILAQARAGKTFTAGELLALQAEAHRFSHAVDVASKVVEQGAQTVKQAVNTPV